MDDSVCIQCGQCINVCPTAAFLEKRSSGDVWDALANPELHVVVQTAPSIRAAIGEGFGLPPGTPATGQMITALRRLGFDAVFDTEFRRRPDDRRGSPRVSHAGWRAAARCR